MRPLASSRLRSGGGIAHGHAPGIAVGGVADGFHDYLGLGSVPLPERGALVFHGRSGTGKSAYIDWLLREHPALSCGREGEVAVVDEVLRVRDLAVAARVMRRARVTLVASHLPGWAHRLLRPFGPVRVWALDDRPGKLHHWLRVRDVRASREAVRDFCRRFGANYTDAALVLERHPGLSFDGAFRRFRRECRVHHEPSRADDAPRVWFPPPVGGRSAGPSRPDLAAGPVQERLRAE